MGGKASYTKERIGKLHKMVTSKWQGWDLNPSSSPAHSEKKDPEDMCLAESLREFGLHSAASGSCRQLPEVYVEEEAHSLTV